MTTATTLRASTTEMTVSAPPQTLRVAHVRRPHGVFGALTITPLGGDVSRFAAGLELTDERSGATYVVARAEGGGDGDVILHLRGVKDRATAEALRGTYFCVPREAARHLGADEWFVWQLTGLTVVDGDGNTIGTVTDVDEQSAHDVLVIASDAGTQLIPLVSAFVSDVDIHGGRITVTPWEWVDA